MVFTFINFSQLLPIYYVFTKSGNHRYRCRCRSRCRCRCRRRRRRRRRYRYCVLSY